MWGGTIQQSYACKACRSQYTIESQMDFPDQRRCIRGREWCFQGQHSLQPLKKGDERRVDKSAVEFSTVPKSYLFMN